jgi:hypothetical protein
MRVKNNTQNSDVWCGQTIAAVAEYDIQPIELFNWQQSDKVIADLSSGSLLIGDGTTYKPQGALAVSFLLGANTDPKDTTGRPIVRTAATKEGWRAEFHSFRITTSGSVVSKKRNGDSTGLCTFKMIDAQGAETQVVAECVESVMTWEPTYDVEIIGATAMQASSPVQDVYLHVTAAPDIPAQYGGSVEFSVGGINLADMGVGGVVDFDGRATKFVPYDATNHSGKWEFRFKHSAGFIHSISIVMELFRL